MSSMAGREICNKALDHIGGKGRELNIKELVNRQAIIFTNKGCIFEGTIFFTGDRIHLYNNAGLGSQTAKSVRFAYRHLIKEAGYTRSSIQTGDLKFFEKVKKKDERRGESEAMTASEVTARMKSNYYTPIKAKPKKEHYYNFGGHTARREQAEGRVSRHAEIEPLSVGQVSGTISGMHYSELGLGIADLSEINKPLNETEKKEEDLTLCSNVLWE